MANKYLVQNVKKEFYIFYSIHYTKHTLSRIEKKLMK